MYVRRAQDEQPVVQVAGFLIRCRDSLCEKEQHQLGSGLALYREAITVEDFSASEGIFKGSIFQATGETNGGALVKINFDLSWSEEAVP
jgi:hypothetical protein